MCVAMSYAYPSDYETIDPSNNNGEGMLVYFHYNS